MQLGKFLEVLPLSPFRVVHFHVVHKNGVGVQTKGEAKAALVFVDAHELHEARREAQSTVDEANKNGGAPPLDFENEELYAFLARALRDADDPRKPLVEAGQGNVVTRLKRAILPKVAAGLMQQYNAFVREEFPDVLTQEQHEKLQAEAEKNS